MFCAVVRGDKRTERGSISKSRYIYIYIYYVFALTRTIREGERGPPETATNYVRYFLCYDVMLYLLNKTSNWHTRVYFHQPRGRPSRQSRSGRGWDGVFSSLSLSLFQDGIFAIPRNLMNNSRHFSSSSFFSAITRAPQFRIIARIAAGDRAIYSKIFKGKRPARFFSRPRLTTAMEKLA